MSCRTVKFFQTTWTPNRRRSHEVAIQTTGQAPLRRPITDGTVERFADGSFSDVAPQRVKSCRAGSSLPPIGGLKLIQSLAYDRTAIKAVCRFTVGRQSQMSGHVRSRASADSWTRRAAGLSFSSGLSAQGQHPREGRAPVPCDQEPVQTREGSLQGLGQERGTTDQRVRTGQRCHRQEAVEALQARGAS